MLPSQTCRSVLLGILVLSALAGARAVIADEPATHSTEITAGIPRLLARPAAEAAPLDGSADYSRSLSDANVTTSIVFILDGSGSISPSDFALQLAGIRSFLCDETRPLPLNGSVEVTVLQYSNSSIIELGPTPIFSTKQLSAFCDDVASVVQVAGGTELLPTLEYAKNQIFVNTLATNRHIILSTDGGMIDAGLAEAECNVLRSMSPPVMICAGTVGAWGAAPACAAEDPDVQLLKKFANTTDSLTYDPSQPVGSYACLDSVSDYEGLSLGCIVIDCNANGIEDDIDIAAGTSIDENNNGVPDECEDCNGNGIRDDIELEQCAYGDVACADCNENGIPDECDIARGESLDANGDGIPDECVTIYVDDDAPNDPGPGDPLISDPLEDGSLARPFDSISEALDLQLADGLVLREIVLQDGTYNGADNRNVLVERSLIIRSFSGNPNACVIDCEGARAQGVFFRNDYGADNIQTELRGVTITRARGTSLNGRVGLAVGASGPVTLRVIDCRLLDNHLPWLRRSTEGDDATVFAANAEIILQNCYFADNEAYESIIYGIDSQLNTEGCILTANSAPAIVWWKQGDCDIGESVIEGNASNYTIFLERSNGMIRSSSIVDNVFGQSTGWRGTIVAFGYNNQRVSLSIDECTISNNSAGGIDCGFDVNAVISNSDISDNAVWGAASFAGINGGCDTSIRIENCSITNNSEFGVRTGCVGGDSDISIIGSVISGNYQYGIHVFGAVADIQLCHILNNWGDGVDVEVGYLDNCVIAYNGRDGVVTAGVLSNCTVIENDDFGAYADGPLDVQNSIIRGNGHPDQVGGPDAAVQYSNIQGGYPGTGNIDVDPLFVDPGAGNYRLAYASPCIDAGSNCAVSVDKFDLDGDGDTAEFIPFDLDGLPRIRDAAHAPDTGLGYSAIVDMGAYEYQAGHEFCFGDLTDDGDVGGGDQNILLANWGTGGPGDLNCDGTVGGADLNLLLEAWGPCSP